MPALCVLEFLILFGIINGGHVALRAQDHTTHRLCDFEDSDHMCGQTQDTTDTGQWSVGHGTSGIPSSGPIQDHTFGAPSGHYGYIDAAGMAQTHTSRTSVARLMSPEMPASSTGYCLRFAYNMHGKDVQTLNVYASVNNGLGYPIFTASGDKGTAWLIQEVNIDTEYTSNPIKIVFEATSSAYKSYSSSHGGYVYYRHLANIAFDDVVLDNIQCSNVPPCQPHSVNNQNMDHSQSCYSFYTTPKTWYDAYQACRMNGPRTHLLSINDHQEQNFIVTHIKSRPELTTAGQSGFWTSGNDEMSEHNFRWTDTGSPQAMNYTFWKPGQPNNVGNDQDCLLLEYPADGYQWGDVDCDATHPYICETRMPE